jgi:hypothetical protein
MRLLGINEATHYCNSFTVCGGDAEGSIESFVMNHLVGVGIRAITEGTPIFDEYRACSLRDAERSLFLAISHYRRCLDHMIPSGSSWAYVTIYYGCWHAAHALLGMLGCTINSKYVVDVTRSAPGSQEFSIRKIGNKINEEPTTYSGSHQKFWDLFYRAVLPLRNIAPPHLVPAIVPIASNPTWQIENRNEINYDTHIALKLSNDFLQSFATATFPACLPGVLGTQYGIFETLLELSCLYAKDLHLETDALLSFGTGRNFKGKVKKMIYTSMPNLISKSKKKMLLS